MVARTNEAVETVEAVEAPSNALDLRGRDEVFEKAMSLVGEGTRRASSGRVARERGRDALDDALTRLDARITSARVDQMRGRIELDSIEVEQLEALHTRCHKLIGSLALSVEPSVDELDRHTRALEREVERALASWPSSTRGG